MRILLTGGGTLGPVTPLLAVAEELNAKCKMPAQGGSASGGQNVKLEMHWIGTRRGPERKLVEEAGIKFSWIWAPKWRRYFDVRNLFAPLALHLATKIAWFKLLRLRPDVIVTAGGFVGVPVVWAASWLGIFGIHIPCMLHNQDVRWSLANKLVAPFVKKITYALPGTIPARWKKKSVWTGNPVRAFVFKGDRERGLRLCGFNGPVPECAFVAKGKNLERDKAEIMRHIHSIRRMISAKSQPKFLPCSRNDIREQGLDAHTPTIMVLGGGTGAQKLNEIVVDALPEMVKQFQVIHITGRGKGIAPSPQPSPAGRGRSSKAPLPRGEGGRRSGEGCYRAFEFVTTEISDLYAAADLVITRAGMGVLSELAALGKPMIIVPIPDSHQEQNALYFEAHGAAVVCVQAALTPAAFTKTVGQLMGDRGTLQVMAATGKDLARRDAARRVAGEVIGLVKK